LKNTFSSFRVVSISLAVTLSAALSGFGGTARAANVEMAFVCAHANGSIRLVRSADQCNQPNETLLGGIVTTRLMASVSAAGNNARAGDSVPFTGSNVSSVVFAGSGSYCVFPANPQQFNLSFESVPPPFFVRVAATQGVTPSFGAQAISSLCVVVAGGPLGFFSIRTMELTLTEIRFLPTTSPS